MNTDWNVYSYEVDMFKGTLTPCGNESRMWYSLHVQNAIVESLLLHTRILVEMILGCDTEPDAINLKSLLPDFDCPTTQKLRDAYGKRDDLGSPRNAINKRLAHASRIRSDSFD